MTKPLDLEKLADEIVRIEYPTYEKSQLVSHVKQLKLKIKFVLEQRLKSACEFYLRYKDNPELLAKEHPEYKEKIEEFSYGYFYIALEYKDVVIDADKYNEWLFKLAFKPIFEGLNK